MTLFYKNHGDSCKEDWVRVRGLYEASRQSDFFTSPRPIELLINDQIIGYEYLPEGVTLASKLFSAMVFGTARRRSRIVDLCGRVGESLADLHQYMELPKSECLILDFSLTAGLTEQGCQEISQGINDAPKRAIHGDFGTGNIWISHADETLTIFDPIPARFCPDLSATIAPIYYDIGHMVSSLWCVYPIWSYPFVNEKLIRDCVSAFLGGYEREARYDINHAMVFATAMLLMDAYSNVPMRDSRTVLSSFRENFLLKQRTALVDEVNL